MSSFNSCPNANRRPYTQGLPAKPGCALGYLLSARRAGFGKGLALNAARQPAPSSPSTPTSHIRQAASIRMSFFGDFHASFVATPPHLD
jgi:hypothetical protein